MSCCCTSVLRICELVICDGEPMVLPVPIPADGTYTLELEFLGDLVIKTATLSAGDNATFDKDDLNERFTYQGRVKNAAGEQISFSIDGKVFDCLEFTTKRAL